MFYLQCMDSITNGLDASTAYDILQVHEAVWGVPCAPSAA